MGIKYPKCKTENTAGSQFCKNCAAPLPSSKEIPVIETLETPPEAVEARRMTDAFELTFNT